MGLVGLGGFHHATGRWVGAVKKSRQLDVGPRFEEVPTNRQLEVTGSDASMWGRRQRLEVNWDPGLSKTCQTSKLSSSIMPSLWWVTIKARNRLTCCKGFSANISYIMSDKWVSMKIVVKESEPGSKWERAEQQWAPACSMRIVKMLEVEEITWRGLVVLGG